MNEYFNRSQILEQVADLSADQLDRYIDAGLIEPNKSEGELLFQELDVSRLTLMCQLQELFTLDTDALSMVLSLIDQLHVVRTELRDVLDVIEAEDDALCQRIIQTLEHRRAVSAEA